MARQVWGTFSVKDHCLPNAFVAEVMLYDRLVIPKPPDEAERARWRGEKWDPELLERLLRILGDRAYVVNWDAARQASWRTRFEAGTEVAQASGDWAFAASRTELTHGLPDEVTGIQTVASYHSKEELDRDLGLRPAEGQIPVYGGAAVAVLAHEFLVPDDPGRTHEDLLKQAVELSSERASRRKRAAFWRWQREFLNDKGLTSQTAISEAVEEMNDLLEDEKAMFRGKAIRTGVQFAFLVGTITAGLWVAPLTAVAVGGAFLSVGGFVADKLMDRQPSDPDKPVSLLRDIQKHFGWRDK